MLNRRNLLIAGVALPLLSLVPGCSGNGDDDGPQPNPPTPPIDPPGSERKTVLAGDFHPRWNKDPQWIWNYGYYGTKTDTRVPGQSWPRTDFLTVRDHPNFSGANGIDITFKRGSVPKVRWGGVFRLPGVYDELVFSYDVMFNNNWDFNRGGKLPGMGTKDNKIRAGTTPSCSEGWSGRTMWGEENFISYIYHPDKTRKWGDGNPYPALSRGVVYNVRHHVKLNSSADKKDGFFKVLVDGKEVENFPCRMYCNSENNRMGIDNVSWSIFYGGNTDNWAPRRDSTITFGGYEILV